MRSDFEQRLQGVPLRPVPAGWREEILSAARESTAAAEAVLPVQPMGRWRAWLRQALWPCPQAWAGLAAIWVVVLALNFTMRDSSPSVATIAPARSSQLLMAFSEQKRLLAELIGGAEPMLPPPPKRVAPRPRTERRSFLLMA